MYYGTRPRFRRRTAPNNAIDENRESSGLGELPEDLLRERALRPPILSPRSRGIPSDNPLSVPLGPATPPPATRSYNPQSLSTYIVDIPAGVATPVFSQSRERSYALIVNGGGNDAVITYGRDPSGAADGIPLASGGAGFHELINGTTSTCSAFAATATFLVVTEGRFDPAMES